MGLDDYLGVVRGLVGGADAGELLDFAGAGLLVQALGVALLSDGDGHVNIDLDEGDGLVGAAGRRGGVQLARGLAVRLVGGNEGGQGNGRRVGEELGDLLFLIKINIVVSL